MISFRDVVRRESTEDKVEYLVSRAAAGDAEGAYVEAGELEQGVLDALHAERDGWGGVEGLLRELSRATGAAYRASRAGAPADRFLLRALRLLEEVHRHALPEELMVRAPEGYIHYALDPVGYALAAVRYAAEVGRERAARAVVVGVRSVGTSLSGIVAAELAAERTVTVRPRGATGARHVAATPGLVASLHQWLQAGGDVLIVDEGPGATGETFHCVARWLRSLGVDSGRIVLFPGHLQPPGLASTGVREFFAGSRRYAPPDGDDRVERVCRRFGLSAPEDLSAGRWREVVPGARDAAAAPRHERLKYRARDGAGRRYLIRYTGLGRSGAEAATRAACLASLGYGPVVAGWEGGFLVTRWEEGRALSRECLASEPFGRTLAAYLSVRVSLFRTGTAADVAPLLGMLRENATEALGPRPEGMCAALRRLERLPPREAVIPDARLQAREWIRAPDRFLKLDAVDHGDGVRLPGPADPAWDVAGAAVEFGADAATVAGWIRSCGRRAPGGAAELARAVEAYRAPYAASALGEATFAAWEAEGEERRRSRREADRYARLLQRELARAGAAP